MGINTRTGILKTAWAEQVTRVRDDGETALRDRVRPGELSLDDYLRHHKGYSTALTARLRERFAKEILG